MFPQHLGFTLELYLSDNIFQRAFQECDIQKILDQPIIKKFLFSNYEVQNGGQDHKQRINSREAFDEICL